jgi:hypothetical protein
MPYAIYPVVANRLIYQRLWGDLTTQDLVAVNREVSQLLNACVQPAAVDIIMDVAGVESFPKGTNLAQTLAYLKSPARKSVVVICTSKIVHHAYLMAGQMRNIEIVCVESFEGAIARLVEKDPQLVEQLLAYTAT